MDPAGLLQGVCTCFTTPCTSPIPLSVLLKDSKRERRTSMEPLGSAAKVPKVSRRSVSTHNSDHPALCVVATDRVADVELGADVLKVWLPPFVRYQAPKGCDDGVHSWVATIAPRKGAFPGLVVHVQCKEAREEMAQENGGHHACHHFEHVNEALASGESFNERRWQYVPCAYTTCWSVLTTKPHPLSRGFLFFGLHSSGASECFRLRSPNWKKASE